MRQEVLVNPQLTEDTYRFLCLKWFDLILLKERTLTKEKIVEIIRNLRDEIDRF